MTPARDARLERLRDPFFFFSEVLGIPYLTPDQKRLVDSFVSNRRTAAPSGHGVGKTFIAAALSLWFVTTNPGSKVITTAPGGRQVEGLIWREIARLHAQARYAIGGQLDRTRLEFGPDWFAMGLSTNEPTRFQGWHAPRVAIVFDEATGIEKSIWEAAEGVAVGPNDRFLAIGNPTDPTSEFKVKCDSGLWPVVELSSENHPNVTEGRMVVPGAVTREWIEERQAEYGGRDTPLYRARVLGRWPEQGDDTLISLADIEAAQARWIEPTDGQPIATGTDVARFGSDETVMFAVHSGGHVAKPVVRSGQDLMATVGMIVAAKCKRNGIDDTGMGGGPTDRLRELRHPVTPFNFGEKAQDEERFVNVRSELWWNTREAIQAGKLSLPPDGRLAADLTNLKYSWDSTGRIRLEPKDAAKKRLGRSPDRADALVIANGAMRVASFASARIGRFVESADPAWAAL